MSTIPVHLNDQINNDLEKEIYKPKDHPGRTVLRGSPTEIPERIRDAIKTCVNGKLFTTPCAIPILHALNC